MLSLASVPPWDLLTADIMLMHIVFYLQGRELYRKHSTVYFQAISETLIHVFYLHRRKLIRGWDCWPDRNVQNMVNFQNTIVLQRILHLIHSSPCLDSGGMYYSDSLCYLICAVLFPLRKKNHWTLYYTINARSARRYLFLSAKMLEKNPLPIFCSTHQTVTSHNAHQNWLRTGLVMENAGQ